MSAVGRARHADATGGGARRRVDASNGSARPCGRHTVVAAAVVDRHHMSRVELHTGIVELHENCSHSPTQPCWGRRDSTHRHAVLYRTYCTARHSLLWGCDDLCSSLAETGWSDHSRAGLAIRLLHRLKLTTVQALPARHYTPERPWERNRHSPVAFSLITHTTERAKRYLYCGGRSQLQSTWPLRLISAIMMPPTPRSFCCAGRACITEYTTSKRQPS